MRNFAEGCKGSATSIADPTFSSIAYEQEGLEVVHINDLADADTLAALLEFDTTYGRWSHRVRGEGNGWTDAVGQFEPAKTRASCR